MTKKLKTNVESVSSVLLECVWQAVPEGGGSTAE